MCLTENLFSFSYFFFSLTPLLNLHFSSFLTIKNQDNLQDTHTALHICIMQNMYTSIMQKKNNQFYLDVIKEKTNEIKQIIRNRKDYFQA